MKLVMVHRVKRYLRARHQGSAALLTTVAISAVLIVLFVGLTTIATREVKQSIATDQSNRALYAAQAGVEDAVRRLNDDIGFAENEKTCNQSDGGDPHQIGDTSANAAWTCRTISLESNSVEGRLDKDQAVTIDLSKAKNASNNAVSIKYMSLEWNKSDYDSANAIGAAVQGNKALPTSSAWEGRAAVMQVTGIWYPKAGIPATDKLVDGKALPVRSVLLSPAELETGTNVTDFSNWSTRNDVDLNSVVDAKCQTASPAGYSCKMPKDFTDGTSTSNKYALQNLMKMEYAKSDGSTQVVSCDISDCNMVLRLQARYAATHYKLNLYYESGGTLTKAIVPDGYATIDVTAKSSNYYRRVVAKKKIVPTVADGLFDNAVFSGAGICKTMTVYKDNVGAPDRTQFNGALVANLNAGKNACTGGTFDTD